MSHIVVLGGGIGGISAAYDLRANLDRAHKVTVVSKSPFFQFTPSNPWVAVKWRTKAQVTIDLATVLPRNKVDFVHAGAEKLVPEENRIELSNGKSMSYDYLVIATGPELAFDEIEGFGPEKEHRLDLRRGSRRQGLGRLGRILRQPRPDRRRRRAGRLLLRPGL